MNPQGFADAVVIPSPRRRGRGRRIDFIGWLGRLARKVKARVEFWLFRLKRG